MKIPKATLKQKLMIILRPARTWEMLFEKQFQIDSLARAVKQLETKHDDYQDRIDDLGRKLLETRKHNHELRKTVGDVSQSEVSGIASELSGLEPADLRRRAEVLLSHNANMQQQIDEASEKARDDLRSGLIHSDNIKGNKIINRQIKVQLQASKKVCKQARMALRYMAQRINNTDPDMADELRVVGDAIHLDLQDTLHNVTLSSADSIKQTKLWDNLQKLNGGAADV